MAIFKLLDRDPAKLPLRAAPPRHRHASRGFPSKTALAIAVAALALAAWRGFRNRSQGFAPEIFAEAFHLRWPARPAPPVPQTPAVNANLPAPSSLLDDDSHQLDPFFAALWKLEQDKSAQDKAAQDKAAGVVTILHYGDSPTTADLITGDVRAQLQARFGDAGRGYTLIARPWAWYGHRGVEMSDHGWKIRTGVGLMREGVYGLGGAAFDGQPGAWSKFRVTGSPQTSAEIEYLAHPGGGTFAVQADGVQIAEQATSADTPSAVSLPVPLPPGTKEVALQPTQGTVTLFGIDFRRGENGLLYDSLGLNGATTTVLARVLEPDLWQQELDHAAPTLIIVNYGSNESSFGSFVHKQYAAELRLAIDRLRKAAPGASILIMSPMDRGERNGLDDIETMSTIPEIVAIQRQVAADTHCAFFDTYDAMGSSGTMARWYAASPRLVTADLLHPTPQGAAIVATLFVQQLSLRYDRWKMQQGIALPPAPAPAAPTAPAAKVPTKAADRVALPAQPGAGGKKAGAQ
jgi:lysophospholipase L1-like esterase